MDVFLKVRLAEDERTGLSQLRHGEGVGRGARILHADIAARRRHVGGVEIVLEHERDAVKRAHARAVGPVFLVHPGRRLHRLGIHIDDGVKRRAFQVVGLDAVEIKLGQLRAGELPAGERRANGENRRLLKMKRRLRRRGRCQAKHRTDRRYLDEMTHHAAICRRAALNS